MMVYRFQEALYSDRRMMLVKYEFTVLSLTPMGVWIDYCGGKKFVNLQAKKRFACATVEDAFASYQARKRRQVKILESQLLRAKVALSLTLYQKFYWF